MTTDWRVIYRLHARLHSFAHRVARSRSLIRAALAHADRPYVAASFGKDSLCMLHLVAQEHPGVSAIWVRAGEYDEWPDTARIAQEFQQRWPLALYPVWSMSVEECYRRTGGYYSFAITEEQRQADVDYNKSFKRATASMVDYLGCDLVFVGLRKEENQTRRMLLERRGPLFFASGKKIVECFPLADWSARDVWAYIVAHDLPYSELYDLADDRETARNGTMFAGHFPAYLTILKRMYPDLYNRFAAEFPEIHRYV